MYGKRLAVNQLQLQHYERDDDQHGPQCPIWKTQPRSTGTARLLDYCRLKDITISRGRLFQYGFFEGVFLAAQNTRRSTGSWGNCRKIGITPTGAAVAWLLRHPAESCSLSAARCPLSACGRDCRGDGGSRFPARIGMRFTRRRAISCRNIQGTEQIYKKINKGDESMNTKATASPAWACIPLDWLPTEHSSVPARLFGVLQ